MKEHLRPGQPAEGQETYGGGRNAPEQRPPEAGRQVVAARYPRRASGRRASDSPSATVEEWVAELDPEVEETIARIALFDRHWARRLRQDAQRSARLRHELQNPRPPSLVYVAPSVKLTPRGTDDQSADEAVSEDKAAPASWPPSEGPEAS